MNGNDIFDIMERKSRETRTKVTESIKRKGKGTTIVDVFKKKQKSRSAGSIIYSPPPYNRKGAFGEEDVIDYLDRMKDVQRYLIAGMPLEDNLKVNIQDWETEGTIEQKVNESLFSRSKGEKELKQLTVKRETFLHFTILSYLGYLKSNYNDKVNDLYKKLEEAQTVGSDSDAVDIIQLAFALKTYLTHPLAMKQPDKEKHVGLIVEGLKNTTQTFPDQKATQSTVHNLTPAHPEGLRVIPEQMIKAMTMTYKLAFKTLLEAFKIYNPAIIKTEEDLRDNLRHQTADEVATGKINSISNLFANYFSENPLERFNYYDAMHTKSTVGGNGSSMQYGIVEFLKKLEGMSRLPESASKIPNYFGILVERTSSRNRG